MCITSRLARSLVLGLAALALALALARPAPAWAKEPVVAFPAEQEAPGTKRPERVRIGSSRGAVLLILGAPDVRAGDAWWVFWDFRVRPAAANPQRFDALVLTFSGDVVSGMKLVDGRAVRRFLSQPLPAAGQ